MLNTLQFLTYASSIKILISSYEVNTNSVKKVLIKAVLRIPKQKTRLAHSRVADQEHLKQKVAKHNQFRIHLLFLVLGLHFLKLYKL